jgi:hypothetical protein
VSECMYWVSSPNRSRITFKNSRKGSLNVPEFLSFPVGFT